MRLFLSGAKGIEVPLNFCTNRLIGISQGVSPDNYGQKKSVKETIFSITKNLGTVGINLTDVEAEQLHFEGIIRRNYLKRLLKFVHPYLSARITKAFFMNSGKKIRMDILNQRRKIQVLFNARDLNASEADSIINNIVKHKDVDIFLYAEPDVVIPEKYKNIPLFAGRIREIDAFCSPVSKIPLRIKQSNVHIYKSEKDLIFHPTDDIKNIYIKGIYKVHFGDFSIFKVSVNHGVIKYYLFKLLPVYKIVANVGGENHYLFNFIKILSIKI